MTKEFEKELKDFVADCRFCEQLANTRFLITGATGLIGSTLVHCLLALKRGIRIVAPVRNTSKALQLFTEEERQFIEFMDYDVLVTDFSSVPDVDYIVHGTSPSNGKFFSEHPVETSQIICVGTSKILEYAKQHPVKSFVFLSSIEVYGNIEEPIDVDETVQGYVDVLSPRSSYPMGKRYAESLCSHYTSEYGVPVKIARLTLTTGQCISEDDNRIINQFSRLASVGRDIVLATPGKSSRPYCYSMDAVTGILTILLKGKSGEAYNIANEETYMSALDLAKYVKEHFAPSIDVRIVPDATKGYAPDTYLCLSTQKLRNLGWIPAYSLHTIIGKMIDYYRNAGNNR